MWEYTPAPTSDEIYHHGVKGMKWGKRKIRKWATSEHQPSSVKSSVLAGVYAATGNKRIAKALDKSNEKDATNWKQAKKEYKKLTKEQAVKNADKKAKKERKQKINDAYKKVNANTSFASKMMFNKATRKRAAKYIVDNNMSMKDAKKRANNDAIRNTAVILGAIGAVSVASKYMK